MRFEPKKVMMANQCTVDKWIWRPFKKDEIILNGQIVEEKVNSPVVKLVWIQGSHPWLFEHKLINKFVLVDAFLNLSYGLEEGFLVKKLRLIRNPPWWFLFQSLSNRETFSHRQVPETEDLV